MARHHRALDRLLLLCWIGMPLGADIVPVSITQQVTVSGYALACDPLCQAAIGITHSAQTFSSSNTNLDLPSTNLSLTGQATDTNTDFFFRAATAEAGANQSSVALTSSNIQVDLFVYDRLSGQNTLVTGSADAYSHYSLVFNLTSPSLVHLTGTFSGETLNNAFISPFGLFQGEILLTGPGAPFDQAVSTDIPGFIGQGFDVSFALGTGLYTLDAVSEARMGQSYVLDSLSYLGVSLNADFTAIPEPKRVSAVLGLLMLAGIYFSRKHPRPSLRR